MSFATSGTRRSSDLERLTELIEAGAVMPSIYRSYSLDRVPETLRYLESRSRTRKDRNHDLNWVGVTLFH